MWFGACTWGIHLGLMGLLAIVGSIFVMLTRQRSHFMIKAMMSALFVALFYFRRWGLAELFLERLAEAPRISPPSRHVGLPACGPARGMGRRSKRKNSAPSCVAGRHAGRSVGRNIPADVSMNGYDRPAARPQARLREPIDSQTVN